MERRNSIRRAQSYAADAREAAREFHAAVAQPDSGPVVFFCSSEYELEALSEELGRLFAGAQVVGCTTAGEIGPEGCRNHSLSGVSLPAGSFTAVSGLIDDLQRFESARGEALVQNLLQRLESRKAGADANNTFALLLIDGLSMREEPVARALQHALGKVPLVGGSAGDGLNFVRTHVYFDRGFHTDSAVLMLVTTSLPFRIFLTQHFVPTEQRVVVTSADAGHRVVRELDGRPAAEEYARLIGTTVQELRPARFAESPMVVMIGGKNHVRSIRKAEPDGSLTFFCAIEEGVVMRVARGADLVGNLGRTFEWVRNVIGLPQLVIGCNCILSKLEIERSGIAERVDVVLRANNVIGFNGYGELYRGLHVNQTFTGIAIGAEPLEAARG
jgi:hypothetical protein